MFCPNCAANNAAEQRFCRSCGLNLEKTAESLLEQLPETETDNYLIKQERFLAKFGTIAFGGFLAVLAIAVGAIIYTIFVKFILTGVGVGFGILLILFLIFAVLTLLFVIYTEQLKEKKQNINKNMKREIIETPITDKLLEEKPFEPIPSVTEVTTNLLFVEPKRKISGELK